MIVLFVEDLHRKVDFLSSLPHYMKPTKASLAKLVKEEPAYKVIAGEVTVRDYVLQPKNLQRDCNEEKKKKPLVKPISPQSNLFFKSIWCGS